MKKFLDSLKPLYKKAVTAFLFSIIINTFNFLIRGIIIVLGLLVVPFAMKYATKEIFSRSNPERKITTLTGYFWLWGNDWDGWIGDESATWAKVCDRSILFGLFPLIRLFYKDLPVIQADDWIARWWWLTFRNPANNLRLVEWLQCETADCDIGYFGKELVDDKDPRYSGWQLVVGIDRYTSIPYFGFYAAYRWPAINSFFENRSFRVRAGYKIKPQHANPIEKESPKGITFSFFLFRKMDF